MPRCGTVVLAGRPNAGKSTLLNALVGQKLAIVSPRPQSTRQPTMGLRSDAEAQYLFVDAPGLLQPRDALQQAMQSAALGVLAGADAIIHLHPLPDAPAPPLTGAAGLDRPPRAPVLTVYTKADLLEETRRPRVEATALVVSAISGEGLEQLVDRLRDALPESPFLYQTDELSTQPVRHFAAEFVREAALARLGEEVPYSIHVEIDEFREREEPVYIRAVLHVERKSQKGIVVGRGGKTIRAIGQAARPAIESLLGRPVYLDLWVKVLPNWRRRADILKRLGYSS